MSSTGLGEVAFVKMRDSWSVRRALERFPCNVPCPSAAKQPILGHGSHSSFLSFEPPSSSTFQHSNKMMWDIGNNAPHTSESIVRMPSPGPGSLPPVPIVPSNYSGLAGPTAGIPSAHSYAGSPSDSTFGVPFERAISAEEPPHHTHRRERRHSTSHPDVDRAIHLIPSGSTVIKHSRHHHHHSSKPHSSKHHHSHSADDRHHHAPRIESSGHHYPSHSQSYAPAPAHYSQQQQQLSRPRIEHPPYHPNFLYSRCTGRKKALCIGINYLGEPHELHGCINDAKAMRKFLIRHHGYRSEDIVLLTDDNPNPRSRPTRRNMMDAMYWLVQSARANDSLFFHYSGHGGQTKDEDGDEIDGMDEVIFPSDFQKNGQLLDDDMFKIMVKPLPAGCRLTALYDSCHSGTVLDLPFILPLLQLQYSSSGRLRGSHVSNRARARRSSPADAISFSACKDGQKSTDTFKGGVAVGAMSWAFCEVMSKNPNQSYQQILKEVKSLTYPRYHQTPQLGSSHHIDMNLKFIV
ncbi:hypothetical protein D9757_001335 [Collybiopsis confluens]|uniref:Peptidase C14 caspase domain-containing protein n=1 Tax=Collybiopsis confluens TaxID=2823264 RepID=A0A8H5I0V8_9AGAR|nr:hypothetical protein D9757_001335 [Collybiopsis confluens]